MVAHHIGSVHQIQDLIQRRDLELPIKARIARPQLRDALTRPQRLQLLEREVLGEPALGADSIDDLDGMTRGEFRMQRDIGGATNLILMGAPPALRPEC